MPAKSHGESGSPLYKTWSIMKERCYNRHNCNFRYYGLRGITVCNEWKEYTSFRDWAKSNGYKRGLTLERMNRNESYNPNNCCWATRKQQARNRSSNRLLTAFNETKCITEWTEDERCQTTNNALRKRLDRGWNAERALILS